MKSLLIFLTASSFTFGIQYNGLRVKFGLPHEHGNDDIFFDIPRTIAQAENEGWRRTERPPGPLEDLHLYCSYGRSICTLYHHTGFVAGIQLAFPVDELVTPTFKPEKWFTKWSFQALENEPAKEYWTITQYLVSEESLNAGKYPQAENGATLQDNGVWVNDLNGKLMRIPNTEIELQTTLFKRQNCIPYMGTHYHYNMTPEMSCDRMLPWFAITTKGYLVGVGFQIVGKLTKPTMNRDWFEIFIGREVAEATNPLAPECFYKQTTDHPILSLHIYYVDNPRLIQCRDDDSVEPVIVANYIKRLLNLA